MGSCGAACAISHLPLNYESNVAVFLLRKAEYPERFGTLTHTTSAYVPLAPAVFGTYNTYAGVEALTANDQLVYQHVMDLIAQGQLLYCDDPFSDNEGHSPVDCEELINNIVGRGKIVDTAVMMIHRQIYDALLNKVATYVEYEQKHNWRHRLTEFGRDHMNMKLPWLKEDTELYEVLKEFRLHGGPFANCLVQGYHYDPMIPFLAKLWSTKDEELLSILVDQILIQMVMNETRTAWAPMLVGSEDSFYNTQILLHELSAQIMKEEKQRIMDDLSDDYVED